MRSALYEWPFVMYLLWEFRCIGGHYGIGGRGRFRYKCTTLKQFHAIDVDMFVNVMDLVHYISALCTARQAPRRLC